MIINDGHTEGLFQGAFMVPVHLISAQEISNLLIVAIGVSLGDA